MGKPAIRGAVMGSLAGAVASAIIGQDFYECVAKGAFYGSVLDMDVFMVRLTYKSFITQFGRYEE